MHDFIIGAAGVLTGLFLGFMFSAILIDNRGDCEDGGDDDVDSPY